MLLAFVLLLAACFSGQQEETLVYAGTQLFSQGLQIGIGNVDKGTAELWIALENDTDAPAVFSVQKAQAIQYRDHTIYIVEIGENSRGQYVVVEVR